MFSELSVFLVPSGTSTTLQFHKLYYLVGNNQVCLVLKTKAVPVFWVFKGRVRLFQLYPGDECCIISREVISACITFIQASLIASLSVASLMSHSA